MKILPMRNAIFCLLNTIPNWKHDRFNFLKLCVNTYYICQLYQNLTYDRR